MMIGQYVRLFEELGPYRALGPKADISRLSESLYAMGFDQAFLLICSQRFRWNFRALFPALQDGYFVELSGKRGLAFHADDGKDYLRGFALHLSALLDRHPEWMDQTALYYQESLGEDGFRYVGGRLLETTQEIVPEVQEFSTVELLISNSPLPEQSILIEHFHSGQKLYSSGDYHASVGQWRSFIEALLRGVWRLTKRNRTQFATHTESPNTKDMFRFLEESGFFTRDEQLAFSSLWGFLSAGGHPGIAEKDDAHLSMFMALTFGHAALLKLETWSRNGYTRFY